jgi:hypothetical protein
MRWMGVMVKMNVVTGTTLILSMEWRGSWSILLSKISMGTRHEKVRVEREEDIADEDVSGVNRMRRGPCVVQ